MSAPQTTTVTPSAFRCERQVGVKRGGASVASRATHRVTVYRMDTDELISTMSPKRAKGWMVVWVRGMAATMVVRALEMMEAPMCCTDADVRHLRISLLVCKHGT